MRVMAAINAFKGSLSSVCAAEALAEGLVEADAGFEVDVAPVADGGEGTLDAIQRAVGGRRVEAPAVDPLNRPMTASFLLLPDGVTAVVELAQASGLTLLDPARRDPLRTTTLGTGMLVRAAIAQGAQRIVLGVGGSATNDGGMGIAEALGAVFRDDRGARLFPCGASLEVLRRIDMSGVPQAAARVRIEVAADVRTGLCGPSGAAHTYAPQKGADASAVARLDAGLGRLVALLREERGRDVAALPGAGAAGGVAACLAGLFGAEVVSGFTTVAALTHLEERIAGADVVITGEGRLDAQTLEGKAPLGVARLARARGVPVLAVCGSMAPEAEALRHEGVVGFFPIVPGPMSLEDAMAGAAALMRDTGRRIGCLLAAFGAGPRRR